MQVQTQTQTQVQTQTQTQIQTQTKPIQCTKPKQYNVQCNTQSKINKNEIEAQVFL